MLYQPRILGPIEESWDEPLKSVWPSASLDAFTSAAKLAPRCLVTAVAHAEALAACHRYEEAQTKICVALTVTVTDQDDPALHNVRYDLLCGSTEKARKHEAMAEAGNFMKTFATMICHEVVPREAVKLLDANNLVGRAGLQTRETAKLLSQSYFFSGRAQFLRAYIDLAQVRALDLAADKKRLLRRTLDMVNEAAGTFHRSLVIALFHAKLLFVLDEYDAAETECRRALGIEVPSDPNDDDLPPVSVSGVDYKSRVSTVRKQLLVLLKQIIVVAAKFWSSMVLAHQGESIISVKVDTLHGYYDTFDRSAAKTISDVRRFVKKHNSWSFWVCPHFDCDGKKFLNTESLWQHMCSKHQEEPWEKLQSILGPELCAYAPEDDHSLDVITLCKDSGQDDIFRLPRMQDMFESLLFRPSVGIMQAESVAVMRQRKCREGSDILEIIKEKLRVLPEDILSTEFQGCCFGIDNLWLKFLEISVFDYREVIVPLARSFQWMEIKRVIAHSVNTNARSIGDANIDAVFGKLLGAPDRNVSMENGSIPSQTNNIDHQHGDNLQTKNLKPSLSDETLQADDKCEESVEIESLCMHIFVLTRLNPRNQFQLQVGKNFASEVVATILIGLHISETSWRFSFNKQTERHVVNPITCGDCICPTHNAFGIKFDLQMSCSCGNCSGDDEYLYTTLVHKLDAGSPQTTKVCRM
uniref:Uncharacterized protein n=1 Tax=Avena sativa TaxID=4498 RepID=A0ACD5W8C4_AVESA